MSVSIVTGASRGIGKAIAKKLATDSQVLLIARDDGKLKEVLAEIKDSGGSANFLVGDIKDPELVKEAIAQAQSMGSLQNLILNAGISKSGGAGSFPENSLRELFETNFFANVNFLKEALPILPNNANIIFLTGAAGIQGYSSMTGYCASKHALVGYARALALEVAKKGIQVIPLCPGPVDTEMTGSIVKFLVNKGMTEEAAKTKVAESSGQKRLLTVEEVAEVVSEICSRQTDRNLTGTPYSLLELVAQ